MDAAGIPSDLDIFDETYDSTTGDYSFGGFTYNGNRVTWDSVATFDTTTKTFAQGNCDITIDGKKFLLETEDGAEIPNISRVISVSADDSGIYFDSELFPWDIVTDEDDKPIGPGNFHKGAWKIDFHDSKVAFYINNPINSISDMKNAINTVNGGQIQYGWKTKYTGNSREQAVEGSMNSREQVTSALASNLNASGGGTVLYKLAVDTAGISLKDSAGNPVSNSLVPWSNFGIDSWLNGKSAKDGVMYKYDKNGINFQFTINEITSLDSVIEALDGVEIQANNVTNNYAITAHLNSSMDSNIKGFSSNNSSNITFQDEINLGRNFDAQTVSNVATGSGEIVNISGVDRAGLSLNSTTNGNIYIC